jgi:SAM-dependent methyltransferase
MTLYFDNRTLFLDRGELSITSGSEILSRRSENFEVFSPYVSGKKFLDVGCCDGRWSSWLLDKCATSVHGIDLEPKYINEGANSIMPQYFPNGNYSFEVCDFFNYATDQKFDAVALFGVLYLQTPELMIEQACGLADCILVDTSVETSVVNGGEITEQIVRSKFSELGFEIVDLQPVDPFENRMMFVASKKVA